MMNLNIKAQERKKVKQNQNASKLKEGCNRKHIMAWQKSKLFFEGS